MLADRDQDLQKLLSDGTLLLRGLNERRDAIHSLLINTSVLSTQLSGLVTDNQKTIGPLLDNLNKVLKLLENNQDSLDRGMQLLAPFYRVFNNAIGNGRWFDNYIQNLSPCGVLRPRPAKAPECMLMAKVSETVPRWSSRRRGGRGRVGPTSCSSAVRTRRSPPASRRGRHLHRTPVKILGVNVGNVTSVRPQGVRRGRR